MAVSDVRDFLKKVREDAALKSRFNDLYSKHDLLGLGAMAKELGFSINRADYEAAVQEDLNNLHASGKLSHSDLQAVAGGSGSGPSIPTLSGICMATMGDTCTQNTIGWCGGPSVSSGTMCSQVTCC